MTLSDRLPRTEAAMTSTLPRRHGRRGASGGRPVARLPMRPVTSTFFGTVVHDP